MSKLNASKFYFFPKDYFTHLASTKGARLWVLKYSNSIMAALISLENEGSRVVEYHLGAHVSDSRYRAMEILIHLVAERYKELNFLIFYLGGGRTCAPDDGLLRFKKDFSKDLYDFNIGVNIFDSATYSEIIKKPEFVKHPDRCIFYRD